MPGTDQQPSILQFGVFELNPHTRELRKQGLKVKIQDQPLQILTILLERPGEVITREEIQKRLWPDGIYVDFDNAINGSIRKLREALSDSPTNPRFVETLSRRGYRFVASVSAPVATVSAPTESSNPVASQALALPAADPSQGKRQRHTLWVSFAIAAAAFLIASAIRFWPLGWGNSSFSNPLPAVPLTGNPGHEAFSTFSPEGTRVAFAWDEVGKHALNIYVKLIGSGDPVRLTRSSNGDFGPAWSPDGHSIAFLRARDPFHATIVIVPSIGGVERELTDIGFDNHSALQVWKSLQVPPPFLAWSGNGKWLLAIEQRAHGETNSVVRVSVETGEKRALTLPPKHVVGDGGLALSPDSGKLAFARNVGAFERDIYLILLSPDMLPKGEPKRITFDRKETDGLAWTADGHRLVFSSRRSGRRELWELSLTSPNTYARLPAAGDDPLDVAISREGKHLVYSHQVLDWDIWRLPLNEKAGEQAQSIISSTRLEYHPTYSPDGKRIAFESNRSGNEEIWTSAADGSNAIQLTTFRNLWAGSPRWSPDGRKIAFDADAAGNWDIYVISSQGGEPARLTTNRAEEFRPSWSGDGKWIYYCSSRSGHAQVWKVPAGGGKEAQVTRNGGRIAFESSDGEDLYYTKDEGGLWKMPVRGGSETKVLDSINQQNFAPTKHGVYFLEDSAGLQNALSLRLLEPKTHVIRTIAKLPGPVGDEICVSPDEQSMLFYKPSREGSELMIIENFR